MSTWVMIDGRIFSEQTACVSIFDRGFLYGDSVFETLRTTEGSRSRRRALKRLAWTPVVFTSRCLLAKQSSRPR